LRELERVFSCCSATTTFEEEKNEKQKLKIETFLYRDVGVDGVFPAGGVDEFAGQLVDRG
jgi:hypothetical protein